MQCFSNVLTKIAPVAFISKYYCTDISKRLLHKYVWLMAIHEKRHRLAAKEGTLKHIMLNKKEKKTHSTFCDIVSSVLFVSCIPRKWMSGVCFNKGYPDRWLTDMMTFKDPWVVTLCHSGLLTGWHFAMLSRLQWGPINIIALTFLRRGR